MRLLRHIVAVGSFVGILGFGVARADIPPENSQGCQSAKVGDACKDDDGHAGACVKSTCGRARGGDYECLLCDKTAAPAEAPKSGCAAVGDGGIAGLAGLALTRRRARTRRPR